MSILPRPNDGNGSSSRPHLDRPCFTTARAYVATSRVSCPHVLVRLVSKPVGLGSIALSNRSSEGVDSRNVRWILRSSGDSGTELSREVW